MLSNKCFTGAYVLNWSHFCCIIIFWGCPIVPILHFLTISNGEGAGSNQCKKMQDWHKTDLKLTQKSLDVWISLDFHLGPPKTNFGIKKQWFRENRTLTPHPWGGTFPCRQCRRQCKFLPAVYISPFSLIFCDFITKTVEIRWNWRCKIFGLKIQRCKIFNKFHVCQSFA